MVRIFPNKKEIIELIQILDIKISNLVELEIKTLEKP